MNDLYLSKDARPRKSLTGLLSVALVPAALIAQLCLKGHYVWGTVIAVLLAALIVWIRWVVPGVWTRTDAEGVSLYRGLGRARTTGWDEIAWIGTRVLGGKGGTYRTVLVVRQDGRRITLPLPATNPMAPDPFFDQKVEQILDWWHAHTGTETGTAVDGESATLVESRRFVRSGAWQVVVAIGALVGLAALGVHTAHDHTAIGAVRRTASCQGPSSIDQACLVEDTGTVTAVTHGDGFLTPTTVSLSFPSYDGWYTADFGVTDPWLESLSPGDPVNEQHLPLQPVIRISDAGHQVDTSDAPANQLAVDIAGLALLAGIVALIGGWAAALLRARLWTQRAAFRRWVPGALPALLVLVVLFVHEAAAPCPIQPTWYLATAAALTVGLTAAWALGNRGSSQR